jgi:hypothetical protein
MCLILLKWHVARVARAASLLLGLLSFFKTSFAQTGHLTGDSKDDHFHPGRVTARKKWP